MLLRAELLECDGQDAVSLSLEATVRTSDDAVDAGRVLGDSFRNDPLARRLLKTCALPLPLPGTEEIKHGHAGNTFLCSSGLAGGNAS